jgi:hypothetical protein
MDRYSTEVDEIRKILAQLLVDVPALHQPSRSDINVTIAAILRIINGPLPVIRCDFY